MVMDENVVSASASIKSRSGDEMIIAVSMDIKEGWFVRGIAEDDHPSEFQLDVRGDNVIETTRIEYPVAYHMDVLADDPEIIYWQGSVEFLAHVKIKEPASDLRVLLTYQPCTVGRCLAVKHMVVKIS